MTKGEAVGNNIKGWRVVVGETDSDHRIINFWVGLDRGDPSTDTLG